MPDQPVERSDPTPYPPALEVRVSRLEQDSRDIRETMARLEAAVTRLEAKTDRLEVKFDATIPHLATKEDLAGVKEHVAVQIAMLPTRTYLWGVLGVLIACIYGGFGAALAAYTALR
jgi:hypothetical protein